MRRPVAHRPTLAWLLYACMVFTVLHCGLGHGQASGLRLAGLDGAFCSHSGNLPGPLHYDGLTGDTPSASISPDCPLCSHASTGPQLQLLSPPPACRSHCRSLPDRPRTDPRDHWPRANPRASPDLA